MWIYTRVRISTPVYDFLKMLREVDHSDVDGIGTMLRPYMRYHGVEDWYINETYLQSTGTSRTLTIRTGVDNFRFKYSNGIYRE
jgi:hypothetical protein